MYAVVSDVDESIPVAIGLTLGEAWTRTMALAGCDYIFERIMGTMRLRVINPAAAAGKGKLDPMDDGRDWSIYRSDLPDDGLARAAIMWRFVDHGIGGVYIVTEERHREEEARLMWHEEEGRLVAPGGRVRTDAERLAELPRWASRNTAGR